MVQNNIHLTAITESATKKETVNEKLEIPVYTVIRNDLAEGDSHGGVLIYHRADMAVKHRLDLQNYKNTLVIEVTVASKKIFFVLVYRKHNRTPYELEEFFAKMDDVFQKIDNENPYCTVVTTMLIQVTGGGKLMMMQV